MNTKIQLNLMQDSSFISLIKGYKKKLEHVRCQLEDNPDDWGRFQSEFNQELNSVFRDIMNFEKSFQEDSSGKSKLIRLRKFFVDNFRKEFLHGDYITHSFEKPRGYAGDFEIIDAIYRNSPTTTGIDRLFDNYAQMSPVSIAIRNRKDDMKHYITNFVNNNSKRDIRILNLACGSCREIKELIEEGAFGASQVTFDCVDSDVGALDFAKGLIGDNNKNVNFIHANAVRLFVDRSKNESLQSDYDLIYSMGLFDYLSDRLATRMIEGIRNTLGLRGVEIVANVTGKFDNPSVYFLDWVGDWSLIYRSQREFLNMFIQAGFRESDLRLGCEQQGIIQYVLASKSE